MRSHTPGPWKATKYPHGSSDDYCIGVEGEDALIDHVAVCSARDAPLIEVAPELLEELTMLVNLLDGTHVPVAIESRLAFARAVISKATAQVL